MGNTKSYPDAQQEVSTTLFIVDFVFWSINALGTTILLTVWILYAYCNMNIIPIEQKESKSDVTTRPKTSSTDASTNPKSASTADESEKTSRAGTDLTVGTAISSQHVQDELDSALSTESSKKPLHAMDFKARLYITLSILTAFLYSYFYVILHTLREVGIVRELSCALPAISLGLGWSLNRLFLYLYLMHRLKTCFQNTFLEIKLSEYNLLMWMYCVLMTAGVVFYFVWGSYVGCVGPNVLISFTPLNVMDSLCALVCLYVFIRKLQRLINMDQMVYDKDPMGMTDLKYLVNKFCIISVFAICFTYFVSTLYFVYPMKSLGGVDTMVNVFCLLITTANYDFYYQKSCVLCRRRCERSFSFRDQLQVTQSTRIIID